MTMPLPITALYTALLLLVLLALAVNVVRLRMREGISLGDGEDRNLRKAIRAHANGAEYIPAVLIALALLELAGARAGVLWLYGGVFVLGRVLHAIGMLRPRSVNPLRQAGVTLSWLVMLTLAAHLLGMAVSEL